MARKAIVAGILGLCVLGAGCRRQAAAQADAPGATLIHGGNSAAAEDPGKYLGDEYRDEAKGFKINTPVNARVISRGGIDVVGFVIDKKAWGGGLQKLTLTQAMSLEEYADQVMVDLNKSDIFKGVQLVEKKLTKFQNYDAMRLTTTMRGELGNGMPGTSTQPSHFAADQVTLCRQQLIVKVNTNQFYVLTFYTPLADRVEGTKTFDAVVGSLELYDSKDLAARRAAAIKLGKEWLVQRTAEEFKAKMVNQPQWFKMTMGGLGGEDIGGMKLEEVEIADKKGLQLVHRDGFAGVQVQMHSWTFPQNMVVTGENVAFWAYSKTVKGEPVPDYSMWANMTKSNVLMPVKGQPTKLENREFWLLESGELSFEDNPRFSKDQIEQLKTEREALIRQQPAKIVPAISISPGQYHILVTLGGDSGQKPGPGVNTMIPQEAAAPLPKIFEYMWPRLVDLRKASEMSFVVFNSTKQTLELRTLVVTGKREFVPGLNKMQECWKCIDEMDPGSTTMWVDDSGRIISMRTSDQTVLLPSSLQELQAKWGNRMAQAK